MTNVKSIGSGGDYADVAAWQAYLATQSPFSDDEEGQVKNQTFTHTSSVTVGSGVDLNGYTLTLTTEAGASFQDNITASDPLAYDEANGAAFKSSTSYTIILEFVVPATVSKLQIQQNGGYRAVYYSGTASGFVIRECILHTPHLGGVTLLDINNYGQAINCLLYSTNSTNTMELFFSHTATGVELVNCTLARATDVTVAGEGSLRQYATIDVDNTLIAGDFSRFFSDRGSESVTNYSGDYNATGHASIVQGANSITGVDLADEIDDSTASGFDARLASDSQLIGSGSTHSDANGIDILGNLRADPPCIGCFEYISAGGGTPYYSGMSLMGAGV